MVTKLRGLNKEVCRKRFDCRFGKPQFPKITENIEGLELSDFIGEDSWRFFNLMNIGEGFLKTPVEQWP